MMSKSVKITEKQLTKLLEVLREYQGLMGEQYIRGAEDLDEAYEDMKKCKRMVIKKLKALKIYYTD